MGLLSRLIGGARGEAADAVPDTATGGIGYDPELIARLQQEHRELLDAFMAVKMGAAACRFEELPGLLANFKRAFQAHMMVENVKLYAYVQQHYGTDAATADFVFGLRKEMHGLARTLVRFVNTHMAAPPSYETLAAFRSELDLLEALLARRLHVEEDRLYLLYQPA